MVSVKRFFQLVTLRGIVISAIAAGVTYGCYALDLWADIPSAIVSVAIIFPIVFSINAAYTRREKALRSLSKIKAHLLNIFYAHRDIYQGDDKEKVQYAETKIVTLLEEIERYFTEQEGEDEEIRLTRVYKHFSDLMKSISSLQGNIGGFSRYVQSHRTATQEFENMRNILIYRTPVSLRSYSYIFLNLFPILFAPFFAYLSNEYFFGLGFGVAVFYTFILVGLDKIQDDLEDPFDQEGSDDIRFQSDEDIEKILKVE